MKLICGLSSIALLSCLSVNSAVAAVKVTKQVSNPISPVQAESVMITDLFRPLQDTVPMISQVDQLIDQDRSGQQAVQKAGEQTKQRLFNLPRIQTNNNRPPPSSLIITNRLSRLITAQLPSSGILAQLPTSLIILKNCIKD